MEAALSPRTCGVLLNSPNNPSGAVYDDEFVRGMVRICEERDIFLLMDDIYHRMVFDGGRALNCFACTERDIEDMRLLVLNGVSKQYAMTGFRIGWAVGPAALIRAMGNIQSHESGNPSAVSQEAAVAAVADERDAVTILRDELEGRRDLLLGLLKEIPGLGINVPAGTFYSFCDFSAFDTDSTRLSEHLLEKVQVVTVPGVEFGMEGHLRISFCGSPEDIREGVQRIAWLLDPAGPPQLETASRVYRR
jgi:aspartate aminotransferase